jgi:dephospho-CoA kinase
MFKVGLTGGIGSGKTTVAKIFQLLGIPVFDADASAKQIMNTNESIKKELITAFGKDIYANEILDRKKLAKIVFNDEKKLSLLNSIIHPHTIKASEDWANQQQSNYVIKEAALLFESGSNKELDCIIGVLAPKKIRLERVINRDKTSQKDVELRMDKQQDEEITKKLCDYTIVNDEEHLVIPQVLALHQILLNKVKL